MIHSVKTGLPPPFHPCPTVLNIASPDSRLLRLNSIDSLDPNTRNQSLLES